MGTGAGQVGNQIDASVVLTVTFDANGGRAAIASKCQLPTKPASFRDVPLRESSWPRSHAVAFGRFGALRRSYLLGGKRMSTAPVTDRGQALLTSAAAALALLLSAIPKILGFVVILIIGWIIASAVASAVAALLRAVRFNDLARRSGLADFVEKVASTRMPGVYW